LKRLFFLMCLWVVLLVPAPANAKTSAVNKILRGATNIVSSPLEIPKQARAYWIEGSQYTPHISVWIFSGIIKGVVNAVARIGSGIGDILTFPHNAPALVQPEYVFQEWPRRTTSTPAVPAAPVFRPTSKVQYEQR
jgi:putative exosortase-associated protein (TIGR04073 family)